MSFASELNVYCDMLPCTAAELAEACGISPSAMSRYRSGQRIPPANSKVIQKIAAGITAMVQKYNVDNAAIKGDIALALMTGHVEESVAASRFASRMDLLMKTLGLRNADLASAAGVDPSYISRIRHGQREPHDRVALARHCAALAARRVINDELMDVLPGFEGISVADLSVVLASENPRSELMGLLLNWLIEMPMVVTQSADVLKMLKMLNSFRFYPTYEKLMADTYWDDRCAAARAREADDDGDTYAQADGDSADSRFFYGLEGSREAELAFIENALLSDEPGTMIYNSNLASTAIAADKDFVKHHQSGLMRFLDRGGRIDLIHNLNRSFVEVQEGAEYWLPLYMTGCVNAYWLEGATESAVRTMTYVTSTCALSAEDIEGRAETRRCHLVRQPSELEHCQLKANALLSMAKPVFKLYRMDDPAQKREYEKGRALRLANSASVEVAVGRFDSLRLVSYPGDCSIIAFVPKPKARVVIYHPRMNEIIANLNILLNEIEGYDSV